MYVFYIIVTILGVKLKKIKFKKNCFIFKCLISTNSAFQNKKNDALYSLKLKTVS